MNLAISSLLQNFGGGYLLCESMYALYAVPPPPQEDRGYFFALKGMGREGGFTVENFGRGRLYGGMGEFCFLVSEGDHPRLSSLHPSQGKFACN